jgi:hypothetical protein
MFLYPDLTVRLCYLVNVLFVDLYSLVLAVQPIHIQVFVQVHHICEQMDRLDENQKMQDVRFEL